MSSYTTAEPVGFVINDLGVGGAERVFLEDLNYLHSQGHQVHLLLLCGPEHPCPLANELQVPAARLAQTGSARGRRTVVAAWHLWRQVRQRQVRTLYATLDRATQVRQFSHVSR
jgi:hypothetical protein